MLKNKECIIIDWNEKGTILKEEVFMGEVGYVVEWKGGEIWIPKDDVKIIDPELQPRYTAYLTTTTSPTNWGYLAFIAKMKTAYSEHNKLKKDNQGYNNIDDHDKFTNFISEEVKR